MRPDFFLELEQKLDRAIETIELLRMQVEDLEMENHHLKKEQDNWRQDLQTLLKKFDKVDLNHKANAALHSGLMSKEHA